jgi:hypothetical protein
LTKTEAGSLGSHLAVNDRRLDHFEMRSTVRVCKQTLTIFSAGGCRQRRGGLPVGQEEQEEGQEQRLVRIGLGFWSRRFCVSAKING